jgi:hypothetical protein
MTARSMTFFSSRTFPRHGQLYSASIVSHRTESIGRRSCFA